MPVNTVANANAATSAQTEKKNIFARLYPFVRAIRGGKVAQRRRAMNRDPEWRMTAYEICKRFPMQYFRMNRSKTQTCQGSKTTKKS